MPRAAMSVATSTCRSPFLKSASALVRAVWLLLPWIAIALMPCFSRCSTSRLAPCFMRVKTSTWCQSLSLIRWASRSFFISRPTGCTFCAIELGGLVAARHLDQRRLVQQAVGQGLDLVAEGRREQQALLLLRQHREHLLDVVDEAHVEHAVGLVEHEDLDVRQVERALAVVVEQAARRGDQDVDAAAQLVDLRLHADAAEHHHAGQLGVLAVGAHAFLDLRRELARRRQDEGADRQPAARIAHRRLGHQAVQHRQHEAGGLAGAGLGAAHDVAAGEHGRDGLGLDRGGGGVALFVNGAQQGLGEAEGIESHEEGFCQGIIGLLPAWRGRQSKADGEKESEATASALTGKRGDSEPRL